MLAAVWVLLSWFLVHATPLSPPPVPQAIHTPTLTTHTSDDTNTPMQAAPEKRLLKYFLPSTNSWVGSGIDGNKRAYGKNYLRFGRSDDDKRAGRNFLRFGRGDTADYDLPEAESDVEKRNRNFIRFGRGPNNFLRFGRSGGPLAFAQGLEKDAEVEDRDTMPEEEKRGRNMNYLRFGRSKNFLRFGRADNRNFLRFGRSVDRQEETVGTKNTVAAATTSSSRNKRGMGSAEEHDQKNKRSKRHAQSFIDYQSSPVAWSRVIQPNEEEEIDTAVGEEGEASLQPGYSSNFQRFDRGRNFLRFGKRAEEDESSEPILIVSPEYPRYVRGYQRNFLRFGSG